MKLLMNWIIKEGIMKFDLKNISPDEIKTYFAPARRIPIDELKTSLLFSLYVVKRFWTPA